MQKHTYPRYFIYVFFFSFMIIKIDAIRSRGKKSYENQSMWIFIPINTKLSPVILLKFINLFFSIFIMYNAYIIKAFLQHHEDIFDVHNSIFIHFLIKCECRMQKIAYKYVDTIYRIHTIYIVQRCMESWRIIWCMARRKSFLKQKYSFNFICGLKACKPISVKSYFAMTKCWAFF